MKVAITIWQDRLSPVFDTATRLAVFEMGPEEPVPEEELKVAGLGLRGRLRTMREAGVDYLLCGAISRGWCQQLEAAGIRVFPFLAGSWRHLLQAFQEGSLDQQRYHMPGCRQSRCRRRQSGRGPGRKERP